MWFMAVLIAIVFIFVVLVLLQVIWIRAKIDSVKSDYIARMSDTSSRQTSSFGSKGYMSIYSVIIDGQSTNRINDMNRLYYSDIRKILSENDKTFIVPNVCQSGVQQKPVQIEKLGFLVCKSNSGSEALSIDIKKKKNLYIVANNFMMIIDSHDMVTDKVRSILVGETVDVFVLYAIPLTPSVSDDASCSVSLTPFLGTTSLSDSSTTDYIDFGIVLNLATSTASRYTPMQMIAYNLYM